MGKSIRMVMTAIFFFASSACDETNGESDAASSDAAVQVHGQVSTILVVTWKQLKQTDAVWLDFTFENDEHFESPHNPGTLGEHREVILGAPAETSVTFNIVNETGGNSVESEAYSGTTGSLPVDMPKPALVEYDPSIAGPDRWCLGSVENTKNNSAYYSGSYWIYIVDRQGRIVWYYKDPMDARILFPKVSADGTHILYDVNNYTSEGRISGILRSTLDLEYQAEIELGNMNWAYSEMPDGTFIYNTAGWKGDGSSVLVLLERQPDGTVRQIWDCLPWISELDIASQCYSNTVNWNQKDDTVLLSMPYINTVLEIERVSGNIRHQWGDAPGSWPFEPADAGLEFNHWATITKDGTLLISSHIPGGSQPGDHRFMEFEIDEANETLRELWTYGEGIQDWPKYSGEATRLENGNTLVNYGTGGSIREVTPEKETAWHIMWDADFTPEADNLLCGHNVFVNDLYALNKGPQQ